MPRPCCIKSREDLTGELCFPALAFSLKGRGILCEPSCLPPRPLTQAERFITDLALTPTGQMRILTEELYFLSQAFSLEGGGILYEPSCPPSRLLTHGEGSEQTSSLLYKVKGRVYWETALFSLGVLTRGEVFFANLPFPLSRPLTGAPFASLGRRPGTGEVSAWSCTCSPPFSLRLQL